MTTRSGKGNLVDEKNTFILGDTLKFTSEFRVKNSNFDPNNRDSNEEEFILNSPSMVVFNIKKPNGVVETFTYNSMNGETTNDASYPNDIFDNGTGIFCIEFQLNYAGIWGIRWEGQKNGSTSIADMEPFGISVTSDRIYIVNTNGDRVHIYDYSGNKHNSEEFNLHKDNTGPKGISVTDNNRVYIVDLLNNRIYVYDHSGNYQSQESFDLHDDNDEPRGIDVTSNRIYVVDNNNTVYVYNYNGERQESEEFSLDDDNNNPTGVAVISNRVYIPDLNINNNRVYVYDRSNGDYISNESFNLHSNNYNPQGIAITLNNIYIIDYDDRNSLVYVFSYDYIGHYQSHRSFNPASNPGGRAVGVSERSLRVISSGVLG